MDLYVSKAVSFAVIAALLFAAGCTPADPLPSWNDGEAKKDILDFVDKITDEHGEYYVPPAERVAVFDNDGTLWSERPAYFQLLFVMDRVRALAPQHPEWKTEQPFKAVLENDMKALAESGEHGLLKLVMATHAGMTTDEFEVLVNDWMASATHPRFERPFTDLVFKPMLEVIEYLRASDFKVYIVSGGGIEFMRAWAEDIYGIPPENIIGSSVKTLFEMRDKGPVLVRLPEIDFINDKGGKPVGIYKFTGRRPIAAFGNSDGDLQMLQWTCAGGLERLMVIVHHTDGEREWAYDRDSHIGRLYKALDTAGEKGWTVVDMKRDWKVVYPFEAAE